MYKNQDKLSLPFLDSTALLLVLVFFLVSTRRSPPRKRCIGQFFDNIKMDNSSFGTLQPSSCATSSETLHDLRPIWVIYIAISINITLCITAAFGNILILVALKEDCRRLHSPSKLLFRSLATTDLAVGLISHPCFVALLILIVRKRLSICQISVGVVQVSSAILCGISIFTLTAMSADRLLALLLGLRYKQIVTLARVRGIIVTSWLVFPSLPMLYFWNIHIFMITLCVNVLLCLAASTYCYMKIYFTLRYRQTRVSQRSRPGRMNNSTTAHLAAYNKTVSISLWIYFTLIASYLPFAIVQIVRTAYGDSPSIVIAEASTTSLVYLNSSLNPVIYFWRIREVRQAVKTTLRRFFSFCF